MIKAFINGQFEYIKNDNLLIGGSEFAYGRGVYETLRTLNHKPVFLKEHLDRLLRSTKKMGINIPYSINEIISRLNSIISDFPNPNQRTRIIVAKNHFIIYTSKLIIDSTIFNGVHVLTTLTKRNTPELKTTDYCNCLKAWNEAQKSNCFEAILVDENSDVFEGSRSNVFWIKNEKLITRKDNVLPGVTRQKIISNTTYPFEFGNLNVNDFNLIDELFITNSGSGIVPVSHINGAIIGNGAIGEVTKNLLNDYTKLIKNDIKSACF